MVLPLKHYLDAERGRAARLADRLDISKSYLSDVSTGKKTPRLALARRLAAATGLPLSDIIGEDQAEQGQVRATDPASLGLTTAGEGQIVTGIRHRSHYVAAAAAPAFAVLAGDILVIEASFAPSAVDLGQLVVAQIAAADGSGRTVIGRNALPWLIGADGEIAGRIGADTAIVGLVRALLRRDPALAG